MRFMVLVKANKDSEAGILPSRDLFAEMGQFNEQMIKAGVMLAGFWSPRGTSGAQSCRDFWAGCQAARNQPGNADSIAFKRQSKGGRSAPYAW
jgi:hypothetical protein